LKKKRSFNKSLAKSRGCLGRGKRLLCSYPCGYLNRREGGKENYDRVEIEETSKNPRKRMNHLTRELKAHTLGWKKLREKNPMEKVRKKGGVKSKKKEMVRARLGSNTCTGRETEAQQKEKKKLS